MVGTSQLRLLWRSSASFVVLLFQSDASALGRLSSREGRQKELCESEATSLEVFLVLVLSAKDDLSCT